MKIWGISLLGLVLLAGSGVGVKTLYDSGAFDRVWDHPLPACQLIKGLVGAEDMVQIPGTHKVLISAADRSHIKPSSANGLYLLDLDQPEASPLLLSGSTGFAWQPHGISLWEADGKVLIFAINHAAASDKIEIMELKDDALLAVRTVDFPGISTLNAVLAIGPESFFVTQDLGAQGEWGQLAEKYLQWAGGSVWLHDQGLSRRVAEKISFPNGLALSPDKQYLYVASMLKRRLIVYQHQPDSHDLVRRDEIFLDTAPDNLRWASDERLLIGAHQRLLDLAAHLKDPLGHRSPSQLIAIKGLPEKAQIEEIFSSRGQDLSGVTTGLQVGQHWVMGSAFDEGVLLCGTHAADVAQASQGF